MNEALKNLVIFSNNDVNGDLGLIILNHFNGREIKAITLIPNGIKVTVVKNDTMVDLALAKDALGGKQQSVFAKQYFNHQAPNTLTVIDENIDWALQTTINKLLK